MQQISLRLQVLRSSPYYKKNPLRYLLINPDHHPEMDLMESLH